MCNGAVKELGELGNRHGTQIFTLPRAHGHSVRFDFSITYYEEIGSLVQSMLANLKANFLVSQVRSCSIAHFIEAFLHFGAKSRLIIGDIENCGLSRSQPGWKIASVMFDQNPDESFKGTQNRAVQHDRSLACTIFCHILRAQTARQHEIQL